MNKQSSKKSEKKTQKMTSKQVVAIIGILLLVALYIVTLIAAFIDQSASSKLFSLCLYGTVTIPLIIWVYTWMYGKLSGKKTITDFENGLTSNDGEEPKNKIEP